MNTIQNTTNDNFAGFATDIEKLDDNDEFKDIKQVNAKVYIERAPKVSIKNEFVLFFVDNFNEVMIKYNLTQREIKVIFAILNKMSYGNQLNITQKAISQKSGIAKAHVSTIYKSLIEKNILIRYEDGSIFFNPNLALKGLTHKLNKDVVNNLRDLQIESASEGITNSF